MIDLSGRFKLVDGFVFYLLLGAGEPLAHRRAEVVVISSSLSALLLCGGEGKTLSGKRKYRRIALRRGGLALVWSRRRRSGSARQGKTGRWPEKRYLLLLGLLAG
jgi:hypothetical protein